MAHSEGDEFLLSGEATGGADSEEEIEVTAAEVLAQLEEVSLIEAINRLPRMISLISFTLSLISR